MQMTSLKKTALIALVLVATQSSARSQIDISQSLPNLNFTDKLQHWRTRTETPTAYRIVPKNDAEPALAELSIGPNDPATDRAAIYFSRSDLPVEEGYYQLQYDVNTKLKSGLSLITIGAFAEKERLLVSYNSAAEGAPAATGETPWVETGFVYYVPAGTVMVVVQLELRDGNGSASYRNIKLNKLDDTMGKKILESQKTRLTFPPFKQVAERTTAFPLKTQRQIYTDADVARARENIAKYPQARKFRDSIVKAADQWLEFSDSELRDLMADGRVPRGFDINPKGCPVHGAEVFKTDAYYPWIIDPHHPFQVKCPVGGEVYPSNDYAAYNKSGLKEKKDWGGDYADDGWGWVAPDGERYWFVAYANHHMWNKQIIPGLCNLSRAYLLTGDKRYAHKAAVMLYRLAEVYPSMDHAKQSRYGALMRAQGKDYPGKILNHIAETFIAKQYAEAYDGVWDSLDADTQLQQAHGKTGQQLRSLIEANLLEDAVDAYLANKIEGNYGMHQNALLQVLLARQGMDNEKYFELLVNSPGIDSVHTGLRYALFNHVYRDGLPLESPAYSAMWIENYAALSELLKKGGFNLFAEPRLKALFDGPLNSMMIGKFTPDWGDCGDVMGAVIGRDADTYRIAYKAYKDARYLPWLASINQTGPDGFTTFDSLFQAQLPETKPLADKRVVAPQKSRLLAGYGLGLLNNPADTNGLALTYGYHGSHYHWDFLNFELFANGQKMMPDLGYPDAMNEYVQEIFSWSTNTIAHNTVVVDAHKQELNLPGTIHNFADGGFARSIDASTKSYSQTSQYRRNLVMVDIDAKSSYAVDFFRVTGGKQHDYSLHGPPGETEPLNGVWGEKQPGTLAGPDVKPGQLYDDSRLGAEGYNGSYSDYRGSGFQYLFNVQKHQSGQSTLQYQHLKDKTAGLRIHLLPVDKQEVFMADAYDKPRARNYQLKFLIARRKSTGSTPLKSTFISVLEPYASKPYVQSTQLLKLSGGQGNAVEVKRQGAVDIIISDTTRAAKTLAAYSLSTDATSAVVTLNIQGELQRVFFTNGTFLRYKNQEFKAAGIEGVVTGVDAEKQAVSIQLKKGTAPSSAPLAGSVAHFTNAFRSTVHPLAGADSIQGKLKLKTNDSILVGRVNLKSVKANIITTETVLPFAPIYEGVTMLTAGMQPVGIIKQAQSGELELASAPNVKLTPGSDVWLADIGIGDKLQIQSNFHWTKPQTAKATAKKAK